MSEKKNNDSAQGMDYLQSIPRRWVTIYIPICIFVFVLLFPFYWMVVTSFKPNEELLSRDGNPFWVIRPTLAHFEKLLFHTAYPEWLWNTVVVSVVSTAISLVASVLAAYAIERLRFQGAKTAGGAIFLAYLVPPSILFIPLAAIIFQLGLFDSRWALILSYPTFLIPFSTWLLMSYFRSIPYELEECALSVKAKMPAEIRPGTANGSTILIKICQRLAPSISAHSSSSYGIEIGRAHV